MEKEIIDFPDYTIDTDTGDVFSYRSGKRKLLKAYERVGGPSYSLYNYDAGTWLRNKLKEKMEKDFCVSFLSSPVIQSITEMSEELFNTLTQNKGE